MYSICAKDAKGTGYGKGLKIISTESSPNELAPSL